MAGRFSAKRVTKKLRRQESCGLVIARRDADRNLALFRLLGLVGLVLIGPRPERLAPVVALDRELRGLQRLQRNRDERDEVAAASLRAGAGLRAGRVEGRLGRKRLRAAGGGEDRRVDPKALLLRSSADDDGLRIIAFAIEIVTGSDVAERLGHGLGIAGTRVLGVRGRAGHPREEYHANAVSQAPSPEPAGPMSFMLQQSVARVNAG